MRYIRLTVMVVALVCVNALVGVGSADAAATDDAVRPLHGKPLAKKSQLVGTWMALTEGPYDGFTFLSDGRVIVQSVLAERGSGLSLRYDVLDGGALSLSAEGGFSTIFSSSLDGNLLDLTVGNVADATQRFRRVPAGKSLADALREYRQQVAAERQQRIDGIASVLKQDKLVIAPTQPGSKDPPIVLKLAVSGASVQGEAIVDRPDTIMVYRVGGTIGEDGKHNGALDLTLQQVVAPGMQPHQMTVHFTAEGNIAKPTLNGMISEGPVRIACRLTTDAAAHNAAMNHIAAIKKEIEELMVSIQKPLAAKAQLSGTMTNAPQPKPIDVKLTLQRTGEQNLYAGTLSSSDRPNGPAPVIGRVVVANKQAYLTLASNDGRNWILSMVNGKLVGRWQLGQTPMQGNSGAAELKIDQAWTTPQFEARLKAIDKFVKTDLLTPRVFVGTLTIGGNPTPAWVQLQTTADGKATALAHYALLDGGMNFTGQIAMTTEGPGLQLQSSTVEPGSSINYTRSYGMQRMTISVDRTEAPMTLAGAWSTTFGRGELALTQFDQAADAAAEQKIAAALADATFTIISTREDENMRANRQPVYVHLKLDPATKKIDGELAGASRIESIPQVTALEGEMTSDHGARIVAVAFKNAIGYVSNNGFSGFRMLATMDKDGLHLSGPEILNGGFIAGDVTLTPTQQKMPLDDKQRLMITAYKLHASQYPPTAPKAGETYVLLLTGNKVGRVWGSGPYTYNSDIAAAAVHAGLLTDRQQGLVRVVYSDKIDMYEAGDANGVKTLAYDAVKGRYRGLSIKLEKVAIP